MQNFPFVKFYFVRAKIQKYDENTKNLSETLHCVLANGKSEEMIIVPFRKPLKLACAKM